MSPPSLSCHYLLQYTITLPPYFTPIFTHLILPLLPCILYLYLYLYFTSCISCIYLVFSPLIFLLVFFNNPLLYILISPPNLNPLFKNLGNKYIHIYHCWLGESFRRKTRHIGGRRQSLELFIS